MRSFLAKYQPINPMTEDEVHQLASRLYREKNKVLVDIDELQDRELKMDVIAYAERKFGKGK